MKTLVELPDDTLLYLIEEAVPFEDLESLASCNRRLYWLASRRQLRLLRERKEHYSTFAIGHIDSHLLGDEPKLRGLHPLQVIHDLISNTDAIHYVKTLVVGAVNLVDPFLYADSEEAELDESDIDDIVDELGDQLLAKTAEVQSLLYPPQLQRKGHNSLQQAQNWRDNIADGDADLAASLLITMLPALQSLHIISRASTAEDSVFLATIEDLLSAASARNLPHINTFSNLREMRLYGEKESLGADFQMCEDFMVLPSLLRIKGTMVHGLGSGPEDGSSLTNIEFRRSCISGERFADVISSTNTLSRFVYDYWNNYDDPVEEPAWYPREIVAALKKYASHSLVHLELTGRNELGIIDFVKGEPFIGSLRDFETLQQIRLEAMMLYHETDSENETKDDEFHQQAESYARQTLGLEGEELETYVKHGPHVVVEMQRLTDVLPKSTKILTLRGELPAEDAKAMLDGLIEKKDENLPSLKMIVFEGSGPFRNGLARLCTAAGVEIKYEGEIGY